MFYFFATCHWVLTGTESPIWLLDRAVGHRVVCWLLVVSN